jgi:hypothetical protein
MRRSPHRPRFFPPALPFALLCLALLVSLTGCQPGHVASDPAPPTSGTEKVLILPFKDLAAIYGENANIRCPLTGRLFMGGPIPAAIPGIMTTRLHNLLESETAYGLIPPGRLDQEGDARQPAALASSKDLAVAGRRAGADLVMIGHLYRFRERVGKKFAVETPASVAFDVHLVRVSDGRLLWTGYLDETQHSLSENLFNLEMFLEREGQWVTAQEMATKGLDHVLRPILK